MAISIRLDPLIEAKLTQQAKLLGVTKSEFINDALERVLGVKDQPSCCAQYGAAESSGGKTLLPMFPVY